MVAFPTEIFSPSLSLASFDSRFLRYFSKVKAEGVVTTVSGATVGRVGASGAAGCASGVGGVAVVAFHFRTFAFTHSINS